MGWRSARWWRRACPGHRAAHLLATGIVLNQWVGYYPTVQSAWGAITAGPLPDQTDAADLRGLRNTSPATGKLVEVTIPDTASRFGTATSTSICRRRGSPAPPRRRCRW